MQTTLIIGASSVIGKTLSGLLLSRGETVITISRTAPELPVSRFYLHDILSENDLPEIEGAIDGLVYCPGTINLKPFRSLKRQDFMQDLEVNVLGAIKCIQKYAPNLQLSGKGSIVLFSTVAVQTGMPYHSSVAVSKGAIEGLTKSLAAEFAPKVRVNCVAPSLTDTAMAEKFINTPEKLESSNQRHPLKRIGSPEDIAHAADFLLSANSSWISGQILHVDGGMGALKV
jgi:3-oxoacyl-[acyl-carrier protein] reductase